jgi:hypothetical protein
LSSLRKKYFKLLLLYFYSVYVDGNEVREKGVGKDEAAEMRVRGGRR